METTTLVPANSMSIRSSSRYSLDLAFDFRNSHFVPPTPSKVSPHDFMYFFRGSYNVLAGNVIGAG